MMAALMQLGLGPVYHGYVFDQHPEEVAPWHAALDAKYEGTRPPLSRREWDAILGSYGAVSADAVLCDFAPELVAAYPEAKVLLVERDVDAWYRSFEKIVIDGVFAPAMAWVARADPTHFGPVWAMEKRGVAAAFGTQNQEKMRRIARDKYREHYAMVRRVVPPKRLLEFRLKDGWGPLCRFLNRPEPDAPFPHVNEAAVLEGRFAQLRRQAAWKYASDAGVLVAALGVGVAAAAVGWQWLKSGNLPRFEGMSNFAVLSRIGIVS